MSDLETMRNIYIAFQNICEDLSLTVFWCVLHYVFLNKLLFWGYFLVYAKVYNLMFYF